jgi:hypothetical protein
MKRLTPPPRHAPERLASASRHVVRLHVLRGARKMTTAASSQKYTTQNFKSEFTHREKKYIACFSITLVNLYIILSFYRLKNYFYASKNYIFFSICISIK